MAELKESRKGLLRFFPTPELLTMPSVGIDISDSSVKFLELGPTDYGLGIKRYGEKSVPPGAVERGEVKNTEALAAVLRSIREEQELHFVRASLPEEKAYLFKTSVPRGADEEKIRDLVSFALEENVPIPPAEAVFDYDIPERQDEKNGSRQEASVVVYSHETIERYAESFKKAGLMPLSFEVEAQAIVRAVIQDGDDGTYMIIDFGRMRTGLAIVSGGLLSFTSTLDVVGETLTEAIAKHFSVSREEAEHIKNESNFIKNKDNSELFMTMMETISQLKDEAERHYHYWNSRTDAKGRAYPKIEKIILCGGSSNVVGIREYLSGSLRARTERANTWINVFSFDDHIPSIDYAHSLSYVTAIGLALRTGV